MEIYKKLAEAQRELPTLPKDRAGFGYKYTDFGTVLTTVRPILARHGLGYYQAVTTADGKPALKTVIFSATGDMIEATALLPDVELAKGNAAQKMGAAITYMRRYCLCAMLGLSSDEDTDGTAETRREAPKQDMAGGETTPEEKARIKELISAKYENGQNVFSESELRRYSDMRKTMTAGEVIANIERYLRNRRADAPELAHD